MSDNDDVSGKGIGFGGRGDVKIDLKKKGSRKRSAKKRGAKAARKGRGAKKARKAKGGSRKRRS